MIGAASVVSTFPRARSPSACPVVSCGRSRRCSWPPKLVQIAGAVAILVGFVSAQLPRSLDVRSWSYLWLNAVGAGILTVAAWHERQWGFLLLEGVWTLVAVAGLIQKTRTRA